MVQNVGVSENSGTPKSSILIGFSIINHPFWGTTIFGNILVSINPNAFLKCITPLMWKHGNICRKKKTQTRRMNVLFVWHPPLAERALKKCGVFFSSKVPSFHGGSLLLETILVKPITQVFMVKAKESQVFHRFQFTTTPSGPVSLNFQVSTSHQAGASGFTATPGGAFTDLKSGLLHFTFSYENFLLWKRRFNKQERTPSKEQVTRHGTLLPTDSLPCSSSRIAGSTQLLHLDAVRNTFAFWHSCFWRKK